MSAKRGFALRALVALSLLVAGGTAVVVIRTATTGSPGEGSAARAEGDHEVKLREPDEWMLLQRSTEDPIPQNAFERAVARVQAGDCRTAECDR